jgi:hypothetical protein
MSDIGLHEDYRDLLIALADHGAEFVLIGGWALAIHGYARGTDDMDLFVRATPENAERVYRALVEFGAPVAQHDVTPELFATKGYGYRIGRKPILIELLTAIDGVGFDEAIDGHRTLELEGRRIAVIGKAALLKNKLASGRAKDLADLEWLRANAEED